MQIAFIQCYINLFLVPIYFVSVLIMTPVEITQLFLFQGPVQIVP